ncbi:hypothetical protein LCGC14_2832250 [marine sediment metagenome]|uniref:Uncharacterized protein n=1 Tax=marine sediment metagenome TaxID=412755 RepID=A0A0F9AM59_9ZZZZ
MKKPKRVRRKARFRVGQVVKHREKNTYHRVYSVWTHPDYEPFYSLSDHHSLHESELRPLTRRERGQ